jgi:hypothetical protein
MYNTFTFIELSHDTFTLFIDDVLFSMLQNYPGIFLFCDRIFAHAHTCMVTIVVKTIKINASAPLNLYFEMPSLEMICFYCSIDRFVFTNAIPLLVYIAIKL